MANWPGVRPVRPRRRASPRTLGNMATGLHLRAGLDLQGVHGRRGARAGPGDAVDDLRPAADDPGRRPGDRGVARARLRQPLGRRHPRPVLERRRGHDRARARRRRTSTSGSATSASASRPASTFPGEEQGIVLTRRRVLGLDDGQPADRPGPLGDPDADGRRLRGDRQRRRPAHAAAGARARTAQPVAPDAGRAGDQPRGLRRASARCSRACSRPAAPPPRSACRATRSPARPEPRRRSTPRPAPTPRPSSSPRSSASPRPQDPQLLVDGRGRQPEGRLLRRHGRRARLRRDRQVRAAVPADPAAVATYRGRRHRLPNRSSPAARARSALRRRSPSTARRSSGGRRGRARGRSAACAGAARRRRCRARRRRGSGRRVEPVASPREHGACDPVGAAGVAPVALRRDPLAASRSPRASAARHRFRRVAGRSCRRLAEPDGTHHRERRERDQRQVPVDEPRRERTRLGPSVPRRFLESPRWSFESCSPAADVIEIAGDAAAEISSASPTTAAGPGPGRCSSRSRVHRRRPRVRARSRSRRAASAVVVERQLELRAVRRPGDGRRRAARRWRTRRVRFYGDPTSELRVVGITGTNGKTTTAFLVRHILERAGVQTGPARDGQAGRRRRRRAGRAHDARRRSTCRRTFRRMVDAGDRACAMEVSSHALSLRPRRRDPLRRRRVHQPDPGPPRLPRRHGGLLPRQAAPVRGRARRPRW